MTKTAMPQSKNTFDKKFVGVVTATVGEKFVKFELVDESKKFPNGATSMKFSLDDLPAVPVFVAKSGDEPSPQNGKQFRIRLNSDGDEVEDIAPANGHFVADLVNLGPAKKDEPPTPYRKPNFNNPDKDHLEFFALYKIVKGQFRGVESAYYLHYKFKEYEDDPNFTAIDGNFEYKAATRLFQLKDWGVVHDLWEFKNGKIMCEPIPWHPVTILPELLDRILEGGKVRVDITYKNGYIVDVQPVQEDDEPAFKAKRPVDELKAELAGDPAPVDDVDAEFQKPAKKVAKKVEPDDEEL